MVGEEPHLPSACSPPHVDCFIAVHGSNGSGIETQLGVTQISFVAAEKHRDARAGRVIGTARSNPRSRRDSLDLLLSARWIFRVDCIRADEGGGRQLVEDGLLIYRSIDPYSIFRGKICIVFLSRRIVVSLVSKLLFRPRNSSPANILFSKNNWLMKKRVMNRITSIQKRIPSRDYGSRYSSTL